jgi:hypothetical protein
MHPALLSAFITMLPRLQADENLRAAQIVGIGTGAMKREHSQPLLAEWSRQSGAGRRLKAGKPGSAEHGAALAGAGIKVVTVPARSKGSPENSSE